MGHRLQMTQESRDIGGAWAGGADGMAITNILLQQLPVRHVVFPCVQIADAKHVSESPISGRPSLSRRNTSK